MEETSREKRLVNETIDKLTGLLYKTQFSSFYVFSKDTCQSPEQNVFELAIKKIRTKMHTMFLELRKLAEISEKTRILPFFNIQDFSYVE